MTTKDYKVLCSILAHIQAHYGFPFQEETEVLLGAAEAILEETFDSFDSVMFRRFYFIEKADIATAREDAKIISPAKELKNVSPQQQKPLFNAQNNLPEAEA